MYKKIIILPLFIFSLTAYSQVGIKGGFSFVNTVVKATSGAFYPGFDIGVTYDFNEHLRAELLYEGMFNGNNSGIAKTTSWIMPVTFGADYRFLDGNLHPFVGMNLGLYSIGSRARFGGTTMSSSVSSFGLYPKVGMNYEFTDNLMLDVALKYHVFFSKSGAAKATGMAFGMNIGVIYLFGH